jgi:hypothetical protein
MTIRTRAGLVATFLRNAGQTRSRTGNDQGAILLIVLIIVTVLAAATAALVEFGFDSPHAAAAQSAHQRAANALDTGLQAAIENTRLGRPDPCNGTALTIADVDGPTGSSGAQPGPLEPINDTITCTAPVAPATAYQFTVTQFSVTQSQDAGLCLSARVNFAGAVGSRSAGVTAWTLGTSTSPTTCQEHP